MLIFWIDISAAEANKNIWIFLNNLKIKGIKGGFTYSSPCAMDGIFITAGGGKHEVCDHSSLKFAQQFFYLLFALY